MRHPSADGDRRSPSTRVVLLSYYFPPMGGAGTQRGAAFARHLPEFGFEPVVVCAGEDRPGPATIAHDRSLLDMLPPSIPITRIPCIERVEPTRHDQRHWTRFVASSREIAWARRAADAAIFAVRRHDAAATVISVSPYACATTVQEIQRRTGRPVILDLRDPWALDGWRSFRLPVQPWIDRRAMRRALRAADRVVANCPAAARAYQHLAGLADDRMSVIPNGFETADFPARRSVIRRARPADPHEPFRVVHVGTLHDADERTAQATAGRPFSGARVTRHLRSGRTLLLAAASLRRRHPELAARLRIELYGSVHPSHAKLAADAGVQDLVHTHGYVDHARAVTLVANADVVHVPLHGIPGGEEALVVPGKLYEAIASGRPVLATVPPGDARRLVRLAGGDGRVLDPDDHDGTADALAAWISGSLEGWRPEGAPREILAPFTRRRLTERLADTIHAATGNGQTPADDPWMELAQVSSRADGGSPLSTLNTEETRAA